MTQTSTTTTPSPDDEPPRARHRRWPWIVAALTAIVVIPALAIGVPFLLRDDPGAKSIDEAVDSYRQGGTPTSAATDVRRPNAGVYSAKGSGHEALSFPPISQDDGAVLPMTISFDPDDCWTMRLDYNEAHWQTWNYCPGDTAGSIVELGGQTFQRWDLGATQIENTSTFECNPPIVMMVPDAAPGTTWNQSCEGGNTQVAERSTSAGPYTLVSDEQLSIDGGTVTTQHYRQTRSITGAQSGDELTDIWIVSDTGLPVRSERSLRIESSSPVGTITYTENGSWMLTSLAPAT